MSKSNMEQYSGTKMVYDPQGPFICLKNLGYIYPKLKVGVFYPKGSLIIQPEDGSEPYCLIESLPKQKHLIVGVTPCDYDLTETTEADCQPCTIWTGVGLDANYTCWPEGATADQIDLLVRTCKGCVSFITRFNCSEVPKELEYQLQTKSLAKTANESSAKSSTSVPVSAETKI